MHRRLVLQGDHAGRLQFTTTAASSSRAASRTMGGAVFLLESSFTGYTALAGKVVVLKDVRRERRFHA